MPPLPLQLDLPIQGRHRRAVPAVWQGLAAPAWRLVQVAAQGRPQAQPPVLLLPCLLLCRWFRSCFSLGVDFHISQIKNLLAGRIFRCRYNLPDGGECFLHRRFVTCVAHYRRLTLRPKEIAYRSTTISAVQLNFLVQKYVTFQSVTLILTAHVRSISSKGVDYSPQYLSRTRR
jgi:hypothetical protein